MTVARTLKPAAALLVAAAVGSALTRNTTGAANLVSNVCFFAVALLVLFFIAVALAASARAIRSRRPPAG